MTTTPTASPELPDLDLDRLEALARAATPGEWKAQRYGCVVGGPMREYVNGSAQAQIAAFNVTFHDQAPDDEPERQQANAEFCAAANPAAVLELIALARRAKPEGEAPQAVAEFMGKACKPAAQQAESGAVSRAAFDAAVSLAADTINARNEEITGLRAALAAQSQGAQAPTDEEIIAAVHACGVDTHPSKYDLPALQVEATSVPVIRNIYMKLATRAALAAKAEAPALPKFMRAHIERAIKEAETPGGMARVNGGYLKRLYERAQQAAAPGSKVNRFHWSKRGMELDPNGYYVAYSAPGTPEAPDDIDYSISKGDTVYHTMWRLTSLEVVDVNWALRAIAVRLGPTGGVVVWPAACLSKTPCDDRAAQLDGGQGEGAQA